MFISHWGGGAFSLLKAFLLPFSPCGGNFATFFSMWGCFFHNLKAFLLRFFHVEAFLLRLSPYGGAFFTVSLFGVYGRYRSTAPPIYVYLRHHNHMRYAWSSRSAIDINVHTHIRVCQTYNIAFE